MSVDVFAQYGPVGVVATLALAAVRVMFKREMDAHDQQRLRADRLEAELIKLNETVRTQYLSTVVEATKAIGDAIAAVQKRSR